MELKISYKLCAEKKINGKHPIWAHLGRAMNLQPSNMNSD